MAYHTEEMPSPYANARTKARASRVIVRDGSGGRASLAAGLGDYVSEVVRYRRFWWSLARLDLQNRFRRSKLGILWVTLQPLLFTLLLSFVLQHLFNQPFRDMSLYIFPGLVLWAWFSESILLGSSAILSAEGFIRQKRLPSVVFGLRTFLVGVISFGFGMIGVFGWCIVVGDGAFLTWLLLPINALAIGAVILPLCTISGILGVLYRDFQPAMSISLQALWFVSPVFIDKTVFMNEGLRSWDRVNPVSNMLELIRMPLLDGAVPPLESYLWVLGFALVSTVAAALLLRRVESALVYRL